MGAVFELPIPILGLSALGPRDAAVARALPAARDHRLVRRGGVHLAGRRRDRVALPQLPLYLLYEFSIVLSWIVFRKREAGRRRRARTTTECRREPARLRDRAGRARSAAMAAQAGAQVVPRRADPPAADRARRARHDPHPRATRCARAADTAAARTRRRRELPAAGLRDAAAAGAARLQHDAVPGRDHHLRGGDARRGPLDESRHRPARLAAREVRHDPLRRPDAGRAGDRASGTCSSCPGQAAPIVTTGAANYDMTRAASPAPASGPSIEAEGQQLFVSGERYVAVALRDSVRSANDINYYFKNGIVTACDDSIPDYYFKAKEIKRTGSFVVGAAGRALHRRRAGDVAAVRLPGRARRPAQRHPPAATSASATSSETARRTAGTSRGSATTGRMTDYIDAQAFFDWRSSARADGAG